MGEQIAAIYIVPFVAQLLVPLALLAWQAFGREKSRTGWFLKTAAVMAYLVAIAVAGLWLMAPWYVSVIYLLALVALIFSQAHRFRGTTWRPREAGKWLGIALRAIFAVSSIGLALYAAAGRQLPGDDLVDLIFPLHRGAYYVVAGGSNGLVNPHLQTLADDPFRDYRGQSYGLDIVQINTAGMRARGIAPRDPGEYVIFGANVYAPCSGTVLRAEDGFPDMPPPKPDRDHLTGNYVFLDCGGPHVLLAHFRQNTVRIRAGDSVAAGTLLGQVGNSGNTGEPHLHVHAQRPSLNAAFLGGVPLPIRFEGRFLARNDFVRQDVSVFAPPVGGVVSLIALFLIGFAYVFPIRRWFRQWGASDEESKRPMAADLEIANPNYKTTLAATIHAPATAIWPWLIQMGCRRGGLYSYDWLDRLFGYLDGPSAERILPDFQNLAVGDVIPIGGSPGFPVKAIEPYQSLLLAGRAREVHWAWEFGLFPAGENRTRLISRNCVRVPSSLKSAALLAVIEPAAFIMTRKMLLGIKRRAENLSDENRRLPERAA